ncbi:RNA-directed DNA polymerase, eukaryota, reverse transcriptase zinc-binding domain protein [Tanacetum coccineum]
MVQGIMLEGVWIIGPNAIKAAFLDFYKDKFSCHDSLVSFPSMLPANRLSIDDMDSLEVMVSLEEIKAVVWDCGSQKALGVDDYSFIFFKKFWELLKHDIHMFVKCKKKLMLFKVDFEKAFDSVSWRSSIQINGSPTSEFFLKRGLRQGDPLSVFLFIIIMEGLHMTLRDGLEANMFHGVKVGTTGIHLSHLFYAVNAVILSE